MYYYIQLKRKDGEGKVKIWIENKITPIEKVDKVPTPQVLGI